MNKYFQNQMPDINKRIKELVNYYAEGKVARFAEMLNLPNSQNLNRIFNIDNRNGKYPEPSSMILLAIANMLPEINIYWLLQGSGDKFNKKDTDYIKEAGSESGNESEIIKSLIQLLKQKDVQIELLLKKNDRSYDVLEDRKKTKGGESGSK